MVLVLVLRSETDHSCDMLYAFPREGEKLSLAGTCGYANDMEIVLVCGTGGLRTFHVCPECAATALAVADQPDWRLYCGAPTAELEVMTIMGIVTKR